MGNYQNQFQANNASASKYSSAYRYGYNDDDSGPAPVIRPSGKKITFDEDNFDVDNSQPINYEAPVEYKQSFKKEIKPYRDYDNYAPNINNFNQPSDSKYSSAYRYGYNDDDDSGPAPVIKPAGKKITFGSDDEIEGDILASDHDEPKPPVQNFSKFDQPKARIEKRFDPKDRSGKRAKLAHQDIPEPMDEVEEDDPNKPTLLAYDPLHDDGEAEEESRGFKAKNLGLPDWLAKPTLIQPSGYDAITNYTDLIGEDLVNKCLKLGFNELFPVQTAILPKLCAKRSPMLPPGDICVSAPTGSGKTLAYSLPLVWGLKDRKCIRLRALVILPTRELVKQTVTLLKQLSQGTDLKILGITGQDDMLTEQKLLVKDWEQTIVGDPSLVDILVTTPGRLVTHLKVTPNFSLKYLEYLIIDEADRLLNQSYFDWLANVLSNLNKWEHPLKSDPHQLLVHPNIPTRKLLFSATLTRNPGKINQLHLFNPEYFKVAQTTEERYPTPATLTEKFITCAKTDKPIYLVESILKYDVRRALCFTRSVESGTQLTQLLQHVQAKLALPHIGRLSIAHYSSDLSPKVRSEILQKFQHDKIQILICSDLASRGLDLGDLGVVINYDAPTYIKNYIHRVGRTARGGKNGLAMTLVEQAQKKSFQQMMEKCNRLHMIAEEKADKDRLKELKSGFEGIMAQLDVSDDEDEEEEATQRKVATKTKSNSEPAFIAPKLTIVKDKPFSWIEFTQKNLKL